MNIDIVFTNITKTFHTTSLYNNLSGKITSGSCTCITGNNGSGKSTFLKIIASNVKPSSGTISYLQMEKEVSIAEIRAHTAFVMPEMQLYDALTAEENLKFFAGITGIDLSDSSIANLLETVQLSTSPNQQIKNFSTGMKQRLKLALLVAADKSVWFLDEPSSNLDESGHQLIQRLIQNACKENRTVLLATNEPSEVNYADSVIHLT